MNTINGNGLNLAHLVVAAIPLLRHLKRTDTTMQQQDFCKAIGLVDPDKGHHAFAYLTRMRRVLNMTAAVAREAHEELDFDRIVNAKGKPGIGSKRRSHIVTEPPPAARPDPGSMINAKAPPA
jgi:hypothetical protein